MALCEFCQLEYEDEGMRVCCRAGREADLHKKEREAKMVTYSGVEAMTICSQYAIEKGQLEAPVKARIDVGENDLRVIVWEDREEIVKPTVTLS